MTGRTASERLIAEIVADGRGTWAGTGRDSFDPRVLDALRHNSVNAVDEGAARA